MRIYPATIRSCCFLHSLRSFAKTNSVKNGKKKSCKQRSNYARGVGNCAQGILSATQQRGILLRMRQEKKKENEWQVYQYF